MLEIGISSNNECGKDYCEICENVKKFGFDNLMIAFKLGNVEQSVIDAKKYGLKIPFVHLSGRESNILWAKGECNDNYMKKLFHEIEVCSKYNIPIAVFHATEGAPSRIALKPSDFALEGIKKLVKKAEECNVKLAVENLDKSGLVQMKFILDNIKSDNLGFCYDAGHHNLYYPDYDILADYGDRLLAVHLHDNLMDWSEGFDHTKDLHRLPFDGKIDYEKVCKKIAETGYNNSVMLEIHKVGNGGPQIYENTSIEEFLSRANKSAIKLAEMIKNYQKNNK